MDLTKWGDIVGLAASPLATLVLAFFVYQLSRELKELKTLIHDNESGFAHKADVERHEEDIARLQETTLELERSKLSVRDYERERATFLRRGR